MLEEAGLSPQKMFGQNFLIDHNLLAAMVELAGIGEGDNVLEVGPGTGVLTERLLEAGARVLAVEIDRGLAELLRKRLGGQERFELLNEDMLSGKRRINPLVLNVLRAVSGEAQTRPIHLVSNLPYNIATPLVCECLLSAWTAGQGNEEAIAFSDLTFTVQREVADRLAAGVGEEAYGPASVLVAGLGKTQMGKLAPPEAFWPRPTVTSRMMRIDVCLPSRQELPDAFLLRDVVSAAFAQRRKKISSMARRGGSVFTSEQFHAAATQSGLDLDARPEQVAPADFSALAKALAELKASPM